MISSVAEAAPRPATPSLTVAVAGERIELRADRTAWLPEHATLLVADLHLGRAESLQADGAAVPSGSDDDALDALRAAAAETGAATVVILGDVVHHAVGATDRVLAALDALARDLGDVRLALGNHDRRAESALRRVAFTDVAEALDLGALALVHDLATVPRSRPAVGGHVHPAIHLAAEGEALTVPCFVVARRALVLPAFSRDAAGARQRRRPGLRYVAAAQTAIFEVASAGP